MKLDNKKLLDAYTLYYFGDALGAPLEFKLESTIDCLPAATNISDDSQLLYLCMEQLFSSQKRDPYFYLKKWLKMMKDDPSLSRNPGDSCLFAARKGYPEKYSRGSGALMRVPAQFAKPYSSRIDNVFKDTKLTHIGENMEETSGMYYLWVYSKIFDCEWGDSIESLSITLQDLTGKKFVVPKEVEDTDVWVADEIFIFIFNIFKDLPENPMDLFYKAVKIDGDSDTVAALVGFLIPFYYPEEAYSQILKNIVGEVVEYRNKTETLLNRGD